MKNLKNMIAAVGLAAVLGVSSVSASTGLMISDRTAADVNPCTTKDSSIFQQVVGIIVTGLNGLMISDRNGIIIVDAPSCTTDTNGIIIVDKQ